MRPALFGIALVCSLLSAGCASSVPFTRTRVEGPPAALTATSSTTNPAQVGIASYYGREFHGRRTASGELYDERELTAAHRTLPFGTRVRVTNLRNDKSVVVKVTDRGPFAPGRIIDLSNVAARELGLLQSGLARVRVDILDQE